MPLIILIASLSILKYFEISIFTNLSWWWIVGLMGIAFVWFEFVERNLGLDKRKAHEQMEQLRKERVAKQFEDKKRPRKR